MSDYTLERISAELDAIFGREPRSGVFHVEGTVSPPSTTTVAIGYVEPAPLFTDNPTAREVCSQHTRIFAALGQEDEFLVGMIRYHQRNLREAAKEEAKRSKQRKRR